MKQVIFALSLALVAGICSADDGKLAPATGSSNLDKAKAAVDKEVAAMQKVAPANNENGFNGPMKKRLAEMLGNNAAAQKRQLESLTAKLSDAERTELAAYAKSKSPRSNTDNSSTVQAMAHDPGAVKGWCDFYHGHAGTDHFCTGVVNWCWDVCNLYGGSKKYYEGPYACGVCFIF